MWSPLPPIGSEGNGQIAQLVEHEPEELGVLGSIPSLSSDEIEVRFFYVP